MADGNIEYAGRVDHQIKVVSYRIEPGEIENALTDCAGVSEAVVVPDERNCSAQLIAYVASIDKMVQAAGLAEYLAGRLPVWILPSRYVMLDQLPKTINGKINRTALPDPSLGVIPRRQDRAAPTNEVERILCSIRAEVLSVSDVSIDDSFISLGGDSLMAVRSIARIQQELDFTVSTRDFFFLDSIALLAGHMQGKGIERRVPPQVPAYINSRARQLYIVLQRPMPANSNGHGLLLVPPLSNEQRRTQRPSSGDAESLTSVDAWSEDLHDAAAALASEVDTLDVVAFRMGAFIAALTPLTRLPVSRRTYWETVSCAAHWLQQMQQMQELHRGMLNDTYRFLKPRQARHDSNGVNKMAGLRLYPSMCAS